MLDGVAGIALGYIVRQANQLSAADGAVVQRVLDGNGQDYVGIGIWVASGLTWFVMALAAALAVKQVGGLGPSLLMTIGAAIFAVGHPFPPGPIGIDRSSASASPGSSSGVQPARAPEARPVLTS